MRFRVACVAVLAVVAVGVAAVAMLVGTAQLRGGAGATVLLDMRHVKPVRARTEMLWFGPGISDELNRMIKLGKVSPACCAAAPRAARRARRRAPSRCAALAARPQDMSPKLDDYIKKPHALAAARSPPAAGWRPRRCAWAAPV